MTTQTTQINTLADIIRYSTACAILEDLHDAREHVTEECRPVIDEIIRLLTHDGHYVLRHDMPVIKAENIAY